MPSVDIVVPNYNYGRYLRACVESVLSQDIEDLRVLIIDNASTDNSVEVARDLASQDHRVQLVVHENNQGPNASFNEGIDWASGDYFMILCSDDMLTAGCLTNCVDILERNPEAVFVLGSVSKLTSASEQPEPLPIPFVDDWEIVPTNTFIEEVCSTIGRKISTGVVLVRTEVQKAAGYFRPEYKYMDDLDMILRFSLDGAVAKTSSTVGIQRFHSSNISVAQWSERLTDLSERAAVFSNFLQKDAANISSAKILTNDFEREISAVAYWAGISQLCGGHLKEAANLLRFAVRTYPITILLPPIGYLFRSDGLSRRLSKALSYLTKFYRGSENSAV